MRCVNSLDELGTEFGLDRAQSDALGRYIELIASWRGANVTGLRSRSDITRVLVADSLSLLDTPALLDRIGEPWLDLGAGAGLPGIPLGIALPAARLTLLEASAKKCVFLTEAVRESGLEGRVRVACERSERHAARDEPGREAYAVVFARAVAPLQTLVELAAPLLALGGVFVASKTVRAVREEAAGAAAVAAYCGLGEGRMIALPRSPLDEGVTVVYEKLGPSPGRLPRREGLAAKRPLSAGAGAATAERSVSIGDRAKGGR